MELVSMHPFCEFMSCYSFSISRIFTVRFRRKRKYLSKLITIKKKNNHSKSYSNRICILLSVFKRIWRRPLSLEERESCLRWITQSQWNRSSNGRRRIRWAPRFLYYKLSFMVEKIIVFLLVCKKKYFRQECRIGVKTPTVKNKESNTMTQAKVDHVFKFPLCLGALRLWWQSNRRGIDCKRTRCCRDCSGCRGVATCFYEWKRMYFLKIVTSRWDLFLRAIWRSRFNLVGSSVDLKQSQHCPRVKSLPSS